MVQQLLQFPFSDQLVQMIVKIPTIFHGVPLILMILAVKTLVASQGVFGHLIWPFEEWLVLNLL